MDIAIPTLANPNTFAATQRVSSFSTPQLPIAQLYAQLYEQAQAVVGPILTQSYSQVRSNYLNFNDVAVARQLQYRLNRSSTILDPAKPLLFGPVRLSMPQLMTLFNQLPWHRFDNDAASRFQMWKELQEELRYLGVRLDLPPNADSFDASVSDWTRLIEFSSAAPGLGQVVGDYYRGIVSEDELNFNLQRSGYRRAQDRDRVLKPGWQWSIDDALRLRAGGRITEAEAQGLLSGAGMARRFDWLYLESLAGPIDAGTALSLYRRGGLSEADTRKAMGLAGVVNTQTQDAALRLQWQSPSGVSLVTSAVRGAFDAELAATYGLDAGLADNPVVAYWMKAYGLTGPDGSPAPGAHDGPTDWMKYYWRGARPVIGFETALELQYRLRPDEADPTQSVVPGAPPWLSGNTLDSLKMMGYSDTQAQWLMGLARQPINIRLINHILGPFAHHADVRAAADVAFGVGVDWVKGAMLDHGFSDAYASVAAAGIHAQAEDRNNEEKLSQQRAFRKQTREFYLKQYETGYVTRATVKLRIVGEQFDAAMADAALDLIDKAVQYNVSDAQLAAAHEGFMGGKLNLQQVGAQLTAIGVSDERKVTYIQEWTWKRADNARMLTTGEILAALKRGLLTPVLALARLTNLGWTQPDALVEIAQVEQELALAAQHQQSAAAAKIVAARLKADRQEAVTLKAAAAAKAKADKEKIKAAQSAARVPLETAIGIGHYDATALLDFAAYNKAVAAGDDIKAQAFLDKAQTAYLEELLSQLKLRQENPGVANAIPTAQPQPNPSPPEGQGASQASTGAAQQPGQSPGQGGGPGPASGP